MNATTTDTGPSIGIVHEANEEEACKGNCTHGDFNPYITHLETCPPQAFKDKIKLEVAGISQRDINVLYRGLNQTKALKYAIEYQKAGYVKGESLVLSGGTGCGKTIASVYLVRKLKTGKCIYAGNLPKIFLDDDESYRIKTRKFLIIDDLGVEYKKDGQWFNSHFDELLHYRHGNYLPTVITTNLADKKFKEIYSERIISRIKEWGKFIHIKDKDMRKGGE